LIIINLLIVVIGILAALVLNTFSGAQERARIASAQAELKQIETAIKRLQIDTDKWPNGCPASGINNPEIAVELASAGLIAQPPVGVIDPPCEWTNRDINAWQGPYLDPQEVLDPWNHSYQFDPDYYPYQTCPSKTALPVRAAIATYGPDNTRYTCDDVFRTLNY